MAETFYGWACWPNSSILSRRETCIIKRVREGFLAVGWKYTEWNITAG